MRGIEPASSQRFRSSGRRHKFETLEQREVLMSEGLDAAFDNIGLEAVDFGGADYANSTAVQKDGKLVIAGSIAQPSGPGGAAVFNGDYALMRLDPDGSTDLSFGSLGRVTTHFGASGAGAQDLAIQSDGKLLVIGSNGLARYNSDGSIDTSFGTSGIVNSAGASWVAVQADGRIVAAGPQLRRFNADGTPDASFGAGGGVSGSTVSQFVIAADGKIVAVNGNVVWRYNSDGTLDSSFGIGGRADLPAASAPRAGHDTVSLGPDGKIVWVGNSPAPGVGGNPGAAIEVIRLNADGKIDTSFAAAGRAIIQHGPETDAFAALVQSDRKIFIVGRSGTIYQNGPSNTFGGATFTARLNGDGSLDSSWGIGGVSQITIGLAGEAHALAQQPDGKIVLVGGTGVLQQGQGGDFLVARFAGDFNESFVSLIYPALLSRQPDPAGLSYFTAALDQGRLTRLQVVQEIQGSEESRHDLVQQVYRQHLGRSADPDGLGYWSAFLGAGGTRETMEIAILGSDEFFAGRQNNPDQFLQHLYYQYLSRQVDPASQVYFEQALAAGVSRAQIAASIVYSSERERIAVGALYIQFFGRFADADGLSYYANLIARGVSFDQVVDDLAASNEYFAGI